MVSDHRHTQAAQLSARELDQLRDQADRTGREAAKTLAELAARLADARDPLMVARRLAARTHRGVLRAMARARGKTGLRGARNAALVATPILGALALAAVAHRRGWLPAKITSIPIPNASVFHPARPA